MNRFSRLLLTCAVLLLALGALAACEADPPAPAEVTRIVTRTVVQPPETVETTRMVTRIVEREVTREVRLGRRGTGGTLSITSGEPITTLNPYLGGGRAVQDAAAPVLEPLARIDEWGNLVPWLAAEIPTVANGGVAGDRLSIEWQLREDIRWSDGSALTADDVVFTAAFCRQQGAGCAAGALAEVASVEKLDDYRVRVNFAAPASFPYRPFVGPGSPVLQQAQFEACQAGGEAACAEANGAPAGTGPYRVQGAVPGEVLVYEVNDHYRDPEQPYFAEVVLEVRPDAVEAAFALLREGETDYAWRLEAIPGVVLKEQALAGAGKLLVAPGPFVDRLVLNLTNPDPALGEDRSVWAEGAENAHPILADPAVREALSLAIDRSLLAALSFGPADSPACRLVQAPAFYAQFAEGAEDCLFPDLERANTLLEEAGWLPGADGIREKEGQRLALTLRTTTHPIRQQQQLLLSRWWRQIGVETTTEEVDDGSFFNPERSGPDAYARFQADVLLYGDGFLGTDPGETMVDWQCSQIPHPDRGWQGENIARWCNPAYDDLATRLRRTADLVERRRFLGQMDQLLVESYAVIPLVQRNFVSAHSGSLLGVRFNPWDAELWNIAEWTRSGE